MTSTVRHSLGSAAGGGGGSTLHYRAERATVRANSQATNVADCPRGTKVVGGGVDSSAGFRSGGGMMINTSAPFDDNDSNDRPDDAWIGAVDVSPTPADSA